MENNFVVSRQKNDWVWLLGGAWKGLTQGKAVLIDCTMYTTIEKTYMRLLISTVLTNKLFFSPRGEDTKTAQPTWITGKGNGRQVRKVFFTFATELSAFLLTCEIFSLFCWARG